MKINKFISGRTEVFIDDTFEFDITIEDIKLILSESNNLFHLKSQLNNIFQFMKAIPDEMILGMDENIKNLLKDFLLEQAERYK